MRRRIHKMLLIAFASLAFAGIVQSQESATPAGGNLWNALPDSDFVISVNVQRMLGEALPRIFAGDPAQLKSFISGLDQFKSVSGFDPQQVSRIVVGVRTKGLSLDTQDIVVIAEGSFRARELIGKAREFAGSEGREERHGTRTLTVFRMDDKPGGGQQKQPPQKTPVAQRLIAITELAPNIIVGGDVSAVQRALDAFDTGQNRASADLVARTRSKPSELIALAGRIPPTLATMIPGSTDSKLSRMLSSIKQLYATMGMNTSGFPMLVGLATDTSGSASDVRCMLDSIRTLASAFLPDPSAQQFLNGMNFTNEGNDVLIQAELSTETLHSLLQPPPPTKPQPPAAAPSPPQPPSPPNPERR